MVSATLIEARKITDKRHGYRGRVSLIDLGNGSEKARINSRLVPGDPAGAYDFGLGAGFYVDATQPPFARNGSRLLTIYFATFVCPISMPIL